MIGVHLRQWEGDGSSVATWCQACMADTWRGRSEHKPQFVPLLGATFFSGELRLGGLRGSLGGVFLVIMQGEISQQFPPRRSEETGPQ
ncbi:hypothetical protein Taro_011815 [Colocasia esculenta]|uniref:Uncharacterized protein n=1 Tax=Colocasia esculenta TaxID=4460 RepID=A0A843UDR4_COLES|nr:hypothetical protein [Colocasia esculenta]